VKGGGSFMIRSNLVAGFAECGSNLDMSKLVAAVAVDVNKSNLYWRQ
jgi:hypothetical protein